MIAVPTSPISNIKPQLHAKLRQIHPIATGVAAPTKASGRHSLSHTGLSVLWVPMPGRLGSTGMRQAVGQMDERMEILILENRMCENNKEDWTAG